MRITNANGYIERFFRTLKEQLIWVRHFENLKQLQQALHAFRDRYMSIVAIRVEEVRGGTRSILPTVL